MNAATAKRLIDSYLGSGQVGRQQDSLIQVLTAFSALYIVLALNQFISEPNFMTGPLLALSVLTAALFVVSRILIVRLKLSDEWVESFGSVFAGLVILNGIAHFYVFTGFNETRSLGVLGIGIACFFLSSKRLLLVLTVVLIMWVVIGWWAGTTEAWLHFAFGLFAATGLKLYAELKRVKLQSALNSATESLTLKHEAEAALRVSEERYALAAQGSRDGLWDWDIREDRVYFSPRFRQMLGYSDGEFADSLQEWFDHVHPDDADQLQESLTSHLEGISRTMETEVRLQRKDGSYLWVLIRGLAVFGEDGGATRIAGSQTDIHERKIAEQELYYGAFHDPLTKLPNRLLFLEQLQRAMERCRRKPSYLFAVIFMDLDRFKVINDSLGHFVGDELLKATARRLVGSLRQVDTIARFGGDEFAILLDDVDDSGDANTCAERIHMNLRAPFDLAGREVFVTASIGIVLSSKSYDKAEDMLRDADTAMYRAKMQGESCTEVFDQEMHTEVMATWHLENDLRVALRDDQFRIWYQPIVSLVTGDIAGFEALLRWDHPKQGMIRPGEFLTIAEETGVLVPVGWWVLRESCRNIKRLQTLVPGADRFFVNVNMTASQFARSDAVDQISSAVEASGLDPEKLCLEITEDGVREVGEQSNSILNSIREMGIHLHLDDFGTGYSSFAYLHRLPLTASKIDRFFLEDLNRNGGGRAVFRAMVNLIHDLGQEVIAEGVETEKQLEVVRSLGCEYAQGFLFAQPMPLEALERMLIEKKDLKMTSTG